MTPDQSSKANNVLQIPWALAATVVSYNVPGPKAHIHLTGTVLANIFLGQITNWNDPAIKKLNPKAPLPNLKITPVYRSDGSGDTFVFTDYLTQVSAPWRANVGNATQVQFPTGVGAKGNDGVAGVIKSTAGRDRLRLAVVRLRERPAVRRDPECGRAVRPRRALPASPRPRSRSATFRRATASRS